MHAVDVQRATRKAFSFFLLLFIIIFNWEPRQSRSSHVCLMPHDSCLVLEEPLVEPKAFCRRQHVSRVHQLDKMHQATSVGRSWLHPRATTARNSYRLYVRTPAIVSCAAAHNRFCYNERNTWKQVFEKKGERTDVRKATITSILNNNITFNST